jgi:hypothetical protein
VSGLRLGVHERLRARIPTTPEAVNELAAGMNERGCPCLDHATACADRNHDRKIRARYPPVFPNPREGIIFHETDQCREMEQSLHPCPY